MSIQFDINKTMSFNNISSSICWSLELNLTHDSEITFVIQLSSRSGVQ